MQGSANDGPQNNGSTNSISSYGLYDWAKTAAIGTGNLIKLPFMIGFGAVSALGMAASFINRNIQNATHAGDIERQKKEAKAEQAIAARDAQAYAELKETELKTHADRVTTETNKAAIEASKTASEKAANELANTTKTEVTNTIEHRTTGEQNVISARESAIRAKDQESASASVLKSLEAEHDSLSKLEKTEKDISTKMSEIKSKLSAINAATSSKLIHGRIINEHKTNIQENRIELDKSNHQAATAQHELSEKAALFKESVTALSQINIATERDNLESDVSVAQSKQLENAAKNSTKVNKALNATAIAQADANATQSDANRDVINAQSKANQAAIRENAAKINAQTDISTQQNISVHQVANHQAVAQTHENVQKSASDAEALEKLKHHSDELKGINKRLAIEFSPEEQESIRQSLKDDPAALQTANEVFESANAAKPRPSTDPKNTVASPA